jgi:hypothetical protein
MYITLTFRCEEAGKFLRTFSEGGGGGTRLIGLKYDNFVCWYVFRFLKINLLLNICPEKKYVCTSLEYKLRLAM